MLSSVVFLFYYYLYIIIYFYFSLWSLAFLLSKIHLRLTFSASFQVTHLFVIVVVFTRITPFVCLSVVVHLVQVTGSARHPGSRGHALISTHPVEMGQRMSLRQITLAHMLGLVYSHRFSSSSLMGLH